jgi:hypothetical protein
LTIKRKNSNAPEQSLNELNEKFQEKLNLAKQKSSSNQSIDTIKDEDQNESLEQETDHIQSDLDYANNDDDYYDEQLIKFNDFYPPVNYPVKSCKFFIFNKLE